MSEEEPETPVDLPTFLARFEETTNNGRCETARGLLLPCPFCAAPDFTTYPVFETTPETPQREFVCKECGRGAKPVVEFISGATCFQFFQTRGDASPPWFRPRMERIH